MLERGVRRWTSTVCLAAVSLLLVPAISLAQRPPAQPTRAMAPEIRLGDQQVTAPAGTVSVPIFVRHGKKDDGVRVSIDYDASLLGYAWYRTAGPTWRVERVAPYGESRVSIVLRSTADTADPAGDSQETIALEAVFYLQPSGGSGRELRVRSALSLGAVDGGYGLDSYFFSRNTDGTDRPIKTLVHDGSVSVYFRDGVEVSGGALTQRPQELTLPVYLTSVGETIRPSDGSRTLTIGVDYDEIFLGLLDARLQSPPATSQATDLFDDPAMGRAWFRLTLRSDVEDYFCHLHVADLVFYYYGAAPPESRLEVKCRILPDGDPGAPEGDAEARDPDETDEDGVGGAGTTLPASLPAEIAFLPPYFVRGNADSSVAADGRGGVSVTGDLLDAKLILDFVFLGRAPPACEDAADVSNDGEVELDDVMLLLNHLFRGGPPPLAPYPKAGPDPGMTTASSQDPDGLGCRKPLPYFAPAAPASR